MANEFETPAEREAKINAANARINEAIAEDVATGMAQKADQERHRANVYAAGNTRLQRETDAAEFRRIHAENQALDARREANNSKLGMWLLASFIAVALFVGATWWSNRNATDTATASSASQPPVVTRTVVVSPSPSPTPAVVKQYVPVPVPVAVPTRQSQPAPSATPMSGYMQSTPRTAPSVAAPAPQQTPPSTMMPSQNSGASDTTNSAGTGSSSSSSSDQPLNGYIER